MSDKREFRLAVVEGIGSLIGVLDHNLTHRLIDVREAIRGSVRDSGKAALEELIDMRILLTLIERNTRPAPKKKRKHKHSIQYIAP